jgi:hypothetical protein
MTKNDHFIDLLLAFVELKRSLRWRKEVRNDLQERGLSRTVPAANRKRLAALQVKRNVREYPEVIERLADRCKF